MGDDGLLDALEEKARALRQASAQLERQLAEQQQRAARASATLRELETAIAGLLHQRRALEAALRGLHDVTYARLVRGEGADLIKKL